MSQELVSTTMASVITLTCTLAMLSLLVSTINPCKKMMSNVPILQEEAA